MKPFKLVILAACLAAVNAQADDMSANDTETSIQARAQASRAAIQNFAQSLQGELQAAMKAGGPVNAISVCQEQAPAIAASISDIQGWEVARTSLKPRNPGNAADAWERGVLESFEERRAAGEDVAKMEHFEVVENNGAQEFRYMKAIGIPANAPCLACHGTKIAPEVSAKLKALYPDDQAVGYNAGDIRGAFTVRQPM
ncbi:MAG: DUF3365 domain-containing protein [Thiohalobacteraceae bacterium]|nr:DUF3365 domain-containing protein [Gammaproteobacteria bacterium]